VAPGTVPTQSPLSSSNSVSNLFSASDRSSGTFQSLNTQKDNLRDSGVYEKK